MKEEVVMSGQLAGWGGVDPWRSTGWNLGSARAGPGCHGNLANTVPPYCWVGATPACWPPAGEAASPSHTGRLSFLWPGPCGPGRPAWVVVRADDVGRQRVGLRPLHHGVHVALRQGGQREQRGGARADPGDVTVCRAGPSTRTPKMQYQT